MNWKSYFHNWPIDETLTPGTAKERGYEWSHDVYYIDLLGEYGLAQEILELVKKYGYKLGSPVELTKDEGCGIYMLEHEREMLEYMRNHPRKKIRV
jgi:hypothetical protein